MKILNPVKKANGARMFVDYLEKGVFDAFEKGFVDRIMLNIHDSDPTEKVSTRYGEGVNVALIILN